MSNRHFSSYYLVSPFEYEAGFQVLEEKVVETAKKVWFRFEPLFEGTNASAII
jgi:hypothetical protein